MRDLFSQKSRNKKLNIKPLLRCTQCHGDVFEHDRDNMMCNTCGGVYPIRSGLFVMNE